MILCFYLDSMGQRNRGGFLCAGRIRIRVQRNLQLCPVLGCLWSLTAPS